MLQHWIAVLSLILVAMDSASGTQRTRRKVVFIPGSKFFVRLNFKANTLPYTTLFAWAAGYKLNFDLPDDAEDLPLRFHRREIFRKFQTIMDENGLNGGACMRRFVCEASQVVGPVNGLFQLLTKLILTVPEEGNDCSQVEEECPLSLFYILNLEPVQEN